MLLRGAAKLRLFSVLKAPRPGRERLCPEQVEGGLGERGDLGHE